MAVSLVSKLRRSARENMLVEVEDISPHGLRASGPVPARRGDWVSIEVPDVGAITARIIWTKGDRFGAAFRDKVDIRAHSDASRGLFEIVTGLPIKLRDSVWSAKPGSSIMRPREGAVGRLSETDRQHAERFARVTKEVRDYLRARKEECAKRAQASTDQDMES